MFLIQIPEGAAWLDRNLPGWHKKIKGDFHFGTSILPILFPNYRDFLAWKKEVGLAYESAQNLGLVTGCPYDGHDMAQWKKEVGLRLYKDKQPKVAPLKPLQFKLDTYYGIHEITFRHKERATTASIDEVTTSGMKFNDALGGSLCSKDDSFSKEQGRVIALVRALEQIFPEYWSTILSTYYNRKDNS